MRFFPFFSLPVVGARRKSGLLRSNSGLFFSFLVVCAVSVFLSGCSEVASSENEKLVDLTGEWKFRIGDDSAYAALDYDDSDWDTILVPSSWENQGYHGYNGYAWYRYSFNGKSSLASKNLSLHLGYIDDVDEVWLNGTKIGTSGNFPPDYTTAYNAYRIYYLPSSLVNINAKNVIAVRVYDAQLEGGIISGDPGIFVNENYIRPDFNLEGNWKFTAGDSSFYKDDEIQDSAWKEVFVPSYIENQGFSEYHGFGWYRFKFEYPEHDTKARLLLLLGKIDDYDEVFLNGKLIGRTGNLNDTVQQTQNTRESAQNRIYQIPPGLIRTGRLNTLAVRVFDAFGQGGIYSGPIGIIKKDRYDAFIRKAYDKDQ
ncbi:MAG: beta galactosidase jelly roll domain-containing protein [Ignavibacteriales bacterium]|nr:MAG: glycoside hydrolase [Ignavibacteriaceae bacterium]MBW7873334.1 beta galactosidase jelly roll domain-containing protein [Ignavibacteria bacterium]MCZ2142024.1 beta galactosidase jelly roll domain-containing protein [Ignavibacteriales bacterium]MBV6444761.1 hypothetical protein [Ignavibacteriaceae bacterium]MBZ0197854.1 beta galactosidase jelly roll domain-containing protein [Ignavibacteriaceae bacterium]